MKGLLSTQDFAARLRAGETEDAILGPANARTAKLVAPLGVMKASEEEDSRDVDFVISTAAVDRSADVVDPAGWKLKNYKKTPVVLWCHDSSIPAIARGSNTKMSDGQLRSTATFAPRDVHPLADTVHQLIKLKFINASSVGFMPLEYAWSEDDDRKYGIDFKSQELLEWSVVNVPANPECLVAARAKGVEMAPLVAWAEKVLDGGAKILVPREEIEALRKAAAPSRKLFVIQSSKTIDNKAAQHALEMVQKWRAGELPALVLDHDMKLQEVEVHETAEVAVTADDDAAPELTEKSVEAALAVIEKAGRVLSAANESRLRSAHVAIGEVLQQLSSDDADDADQSDADKNNENNTTKNTAANAEANTEGEVQTDAPSRRSVDVPGRAKARQFPRRTAREVELQRLKAG